MTRDGSPPSADVFRSRQQDIAVDEQHAREGRLAEPGRMFGYGLQNGLDFGRGGGDDAQDLARRRLLLERLRQARFERADRRFRSAPRLLDGGRPRRHFSLRGRCTPRHGLSSLVSASLPATPDDRLGEDAGAGKGWTA